MPKKIKINKLKLNLGCRSESKLTTNLHFNDIRIKINKYCMFTYPPMTAFLPSADIDKAVTCAFENWSVVLLHIVDSDGVEVLLVCSIIKFCTVVYYILRAFYKKLLGIQGSINRNLGMSNLGKILLDSSCRSPLGAETPSTSTSSPRFYMYKLLLY